MAALTCATMTATGSPSAAAADGRDKLAQAIANTRGSYLVYNFGSGYPAPLLNAAGASSTAPRSLRRKLPPPKIA